MAFQKGHKKLGGRPKGGQNQVTKSARDAFVLAFEGLGGVPSLLRWAQDEKNTTEFYRLFARLIPTEHVGPGGEGPIQTNVYHSYEPKP